MYLNGLMLISSVLDIGHADFNAGNDLPYTLFLPTYAAIAHYHGLHGDRPLREVLAEAEAFAVARLPVGAGPRRPAVGKRARATIVARSRRLTGLTPTTSTGSTCGSSTSSSSPSCCATAAQAVGRLDGRFLGWDADYGRRGQLTADPSSTRSSARTPPRSTSYLRAELGYSSDLPYKILTGKVHRRGRTRSSRATRHVADKLAAGDARQPAPAGPRRLRLLRRRDAVLRRRAHVRAPARSRRELAATSSRPTTRPAT